jgi:glycosyltransferase A (GT-A) superfamily protein (DUF2064 family)
MRWRTANNRRRKRRQSRWSSAKAWLLHWHRTMEIEGAWFRACMVDPLVAQIVLGVSIDGGFYVAEPPKPATFVDPRRNAL